MTTSEITSETVHKLLSIVDQGLVIGVGKPIPGQMCVEAAVCRALGLPHGDKPPVAPALRVFNTILNDAIWSSDEARAVGLRKLAILQLNSIGINEIEFASRLAIATVNKVLPIVLNNVCQHASTLADALDIADAAANAAVDAADAITAADAAHAVEAARAAARAATRAAATDVVLITSVKIAEDILIDMNVPGCQWLSLCQ